MAQANSEAFAHSAFGELTAIVKRELGESIVIAQFAISHTAARVETNGHHVLYITSGLSEVFTYF